jgi:hypothetical protein
LLGGWLKDPFEINVHVCQTKMKRKEKKYSKDLERTFWNEKRMKRLKEQTDKYLQCTLALKHRQ